MPKKTPKPRIAITTPDVRPSRMASAARLCRVTCGGVNTVGDDAAVTYP
jgi:hypothetical protein